MQVNINIEKNNCQFEQCRYYEDGICLSDEARRDCVEIATAVLCISDEVANEGRLQKGV